MTHFVQAGIERAELTGRLVPALDRGSVVLLADAGFGKTTALEQALSRRNDAVVWLRVTAADRDPGRLVARLVDRVRVRLPGVAEDHAERLARAIDPLDARAVAQDLVDELERLLVEPLVIVIDDAEQLEDSPSLAIVDRLLAGAELIRVGLCSRRALRLRLAKLRASGRLLELGPGDLAFSPAECAACLGAIRGGEPTGDEVERLFTLTEGWPLGVALAAAAAPRAGELAPASREAIFDYLAEEVLDGLDPELGERLRDASIVDELDSELEPALGLPVSFRDDLVAHGLFIRSAEDGDAYAIHPLLRELLRARLAADRDGARVDDLHIRAAGALAARGQAPEAIDHWLAAGAFDEAAAAIAAHGVALSGTAPETVGGWLAQLPEEVRERPILRLLAGRLAMGEGDFGAAVEQCATAVAELERAGEAPAIVWAARLALTEAQLAALDLEAALATSAGAETAGSEGGPGAIFCALGRVATLARLGRRDEAEGTLDQALAQPRGMELLGPGLPAFRAHAFELPAGHVAAALEHVDAGIAALRARGMLSRLPYVLAFKMAIQEARGELEQALETFDELLETARRTGLAGYVGAGARLAAASMLAQLGRTSEARTQLEQVGRYGSWAGCDRELAQAVLAGGAGDGPAAVGFGRRALDEAERMPPFDRVRVASVLAPVLCEAGAADAARDGLEAVLAALRPGESTARTRAALACVHHRLGDRDAAHEALAAALEEAGDAGRFVLRSEWPQIEPVLWSALEDEAVPIETTIAALDAAFPGGPEVVALADHPVAAVADAALLAAAASGRPEALARVAESKPAVDVRERLLRRPPSLALRTLGRFEVRRGSWLVDPAAWERKVAERVVRFLLVRGGALVPEDELFEAFWPGKTPASARRGLQTAISSARSVLDLPWEESRLHVDERAYALALSDGDSLDADAFEAAAERALAAHGPERLVRLEAAARIWTGEPLPEERYSDWATSWRERLSSLQGDVLGALAEEHGGRGDHPAAVRAARALVDLDPLDEHSQRLLIRAYAAAGRRGDALRQFLECRRALVGELGIEPAAETVTLQRRILAGDGA